MNATATHNAADEKVIAMYDEAAAIFDKLRQGSLPEEEHRAEYIRAREIQRKAEKDWKYL